MDENARIYRVGVLAYSVLFIALLAVAGVVLANPALIGIALCIAALGALSYATATWGLMRSALALSIVSLLFSAAALLMVAWNVTLGVVR